MNPSTSASSAYFNIPYDPQSPGFNAEALLGDQDLSPTDASASVESSSTHPKVLQKEFTNRIIEASKKNKSQKQTSADRTRKIKTLTGDLDRLTRQIKDLEKAQRPLSQQRIQRSHTAPLQGSRIKSCSSHSVKKPAENALTSQKKKEEDFRVLKWKK